MTEDLKDRLDRAYGNGDFFFYPWVGEQYDEGASIFGMTSRKRILVIGASRYCMQLHNDGDCMEKDVCLDCIKPETLKELICPYVERYEDLSLKDMNEAAILDWLNGYEKPRAYNGFAKHFAGVIGLEKRKESIWDHVAFCNYIQPILLETDTPRYKDANIQYDYSREVVERLIDALKPDIILLWASSSLRKAMRKLFSEDHVSKRGVWIPSIGKSYARRTIMVNGEPYKLLTCPHPSDNRKNLMSDYIERLEAIEKTDSFLRFATLSETERQEDRREAGNPFTLPVGDNRIVNPEEESEELTWREFLYVLWELTVSGWLEN